MPKHPVLSEEPAVASLPLERRRSALSYLRHVLPQGQTLPDDAWRRRHQALLALLWLHAAGLPLFGIAQGYGTAHNIGHGAGLALIALLATLASDRRKLAGALVSLGLITSSALLVHVWHGVIEGHFHFFVMIVILSLYEDWLPFLLAAAYVVVHHGLTGAVDPGAVYNHPDAVAHPWKWAAIHGLFVTAAGIGSVAAWRLNEDVRAKSRESYRRARESEERFKGAFADAPIGMVLIAIEPSRRGRFLQVNRALCEFTGYSEKQLVGSSLRSITYPEDAEESAISFERVVLGEIPRFQAENRYIRADGRVVWGLVNISLVSDCGNPLYAIAQVQDITEQKRAQDQLAHQAFHDPLTGLPNRRRLLADLEQQLASATRAEPTVLLLFDLDGFKAYNDTYGHPAGDSLLIRLGRNLTGVVGDHGTPYRMGGDEFCVMAAVDAKDRDAIERIASHTAAALSERGEGFVVTASYGSVLLPTEATTCSEALRKADQRMYARKALDSRASAGRQTTDVLLRVLSERNPDLGIHLGRVTQLCRRVADKFAMPDDELSALLQAASLHDVGKAAIPDEILNKRGPLDAEEWDFVRRHPLIGERILSAAPALARAAKLVRSSHERFDGGGYPDGLAGEDIPLAGRIIAVCDAFEAMTSRRPYRTPMSTEVALSELRRSGGSQFDPVVVDAFSAVLAEGVKDIEAASPPSKVL